MCLWRNSSGTIVRSLVLLYVRWYFTRSATTGLYLLVVVLLTLVLLMVILPIVLLIICTTSGTISYTTQSY